MKGIDIFCASQASTAICINMEQGSSSSSSSSSTILLTGGGGGGGPAIDRHNPIITDSRRAPKSLPPRPTSQPPLAPKSTQKSQNRKKKKKNIEIPFKENEDKLKESEISPVTIDRHDENNTNSTDSGGNGGATHVILKQSWSCTKPGDFISPPGSTRYLLRDKVFFNDLSDFDPAQKKFVEENSEDVKITEELFDEKSPSPSKSPEQVVYLKVSLHCRGCERKLRKHLSKMEGVTAFNIDFVAKKVTVTGKVTPLGVLSSISKVKNAQLWNPTISTTPYATPLSHNLIDDSDFMNEFKGVAA